MSEQTIFNDSHQESVSPVTPAISAPTNTVPPELVELVGEGKKYATVAAALAAFVPAQKHISKLEADYAELKMELDKRRTTQELLDEIKSGIPNPVTPVTKELNQDDLMQVVSKVIEQKETEKSFTANARTVAQTFKEIFGDRAEEQYSKVASDAGLSVGMLNQLARTSPLAVIKLAGIQKTTPQAGKINSDVDTSRMVSNTSGELSAKVGGKGTTRDVVNAWKIAGEKAKKNLELNS